MRPRRVRNPIKATAREPINRPDTYERFPKSCQILNCEQQPTHTKGPKASYFYAWVIPQAAAAPHDRLEAIADGRELP